jgi:CheY-like chemotaxis protein
MDDDPIIRNVCSRLLRQLGYEVDVAADGEEAIEKYRAAMAEDRPYRAVVLDLTVRGGMGGAEAIQRLLRLDPGVRAVVSSGYFNDPVMAEYRKHGFMAVVAKPYQIEEFSKVLSDVINAEQPVPEGGVA